MTLSGHSLLFASMRHILFFIYLPLACGFALTRGGLPERIASVTILAGTAATLFVAPTLPYRFRHVEPGIFAVDLAMFLIFTGLALRSTRFWPIWIAGLQGATVVMHCARLIASQVVPQAYMDAVALWSYPLIAILAIGTWRHGRRLRTLGSDPAWKG